MTQKIKWKGEIQSIQCRAWVWRYQTSNRTHHHTGFNLWIDGEADGKEGKFILAVSDTQYQKMQFCIDDVFKGTAWPCVKAKHDIADYYRAGSFKRISSSENNTLSAVPPFNNPLPPLEVFEQRGARMLDSKLWSKKCFTCMWANKSAVEIEYDFGKVKRYRKETFCYGPLSCPQYQMGKGRPVQYKDTFDSIDNGSMDEMLTYHRGENE